MREISQGLLTALDADFAENRRKRYRLYTHPVFYPYRQIAMLAVVVNLWIFLARPVEFWLTGSDAALGAISQMAFANLTLGIIMRQQRVINLLFSAATNVPRSWPLWFRWMAGKVYNFGGVHSGCTVSGSLWYGLFLYGLLRSVRDGGAVSLQTAALGCAVLVLLAVIILTALGPLRERFHDLFERVHRFGGWSVLALFWAQAILFAGDMGQPFLNSVAFWELTLITCSIVLPWTHLKRVPVKIVKPSNHAVIVNFDYGRDAFPGSTNAISRNPLLEWHPFASIPKPGSDDHRIIISRAGNWTSSFIDDCPSHVWVRGVATAGAARVGLMFERVVFVATGSGIGPILPHLLSRKDPCALLWVTRSPEKTYGRALVDEVRQACPVHTIWNTDERGKPDLADLTREAVKRFDADAVVIISNRKGSWHVTGTLEAEGIPCFSPIWDS
ncbi:hypothetical protein [Pseudoroseicyclus aestuarii]|uniref:Ferric reductase n=1 Tax=Pseudoroseicyclus aestuarii TaxID=1795041 RepID=A0A318TAM6_9RHOB|nr:hypothetical protein [Pseudoroseicyclus aestuarii]PYE85358.1 hypothetical protein DFP88_10122 [Pseudoroseicyclus aestuarii]